MRDPFRIILSLSACFAVAVSGCQSATPAGDRHGTAVGERVILPALVTVSDDMMLGDLDDTWETFRNDPPTTGRRTPDRDWAIFVEVRHREHLRTAGGRPREHTVTRTQAIHRRGERR